MPEAMQERGEMKQVRGWRRRVGPYLELTKARLSALVVMTALVGFVIGSPGPIDPIRLVWTLLGTALAAGGANALNQWWEVERDRLMARTRGRPLPSRRLSRGGALLYGAAITIAGPALLALWVGTLPALLALAAATLYVFVYTPLKARSPLCTLAGAVVGAIPPLLGWAAAAGSIQAGGWVLGTILFIWQIPHFLALAWLYREDYARADFRMLPVVDRGGHTTFRMVLLYSLVLPPAALALTLTGAAGPLYAAGSLLLGLALLLLGMQLYRRRGDREARRLFLASVIYLPLLLGLMMIDRGPGRSPAAYAIDERIEPSPRSAGELEHRAGGDDHVIHMPR